MNENDRRNRPSPAERVRPLQVRVQALGPAERLEPAPPPQGRVPLREVERRYIAKLLRELDGHRTHVARALGISERNLYRKLREYRLA